MAISQMKTPLAKLREKLGPLGRPQAFCETFNVSESWLKKASCGAIPIPPDSGIAFKLHKHTGVSISWLCGNIESDEVKYSTKYDQENDPYLLKRIIASLTEERDYWKNEALNK